MDAQDFAAPRVALDAADLAVPRDEVRVLLEELDLGRRCPVDDDDRVPFRVRWDAVARSSRSRTTPLSMVQRLVQPR